jgi:hypothetical protein
VIRNAKRGTSQQLTFLSTALRIRLGMLRDLCELDVLRVSYVESAKNRADPLTKALGPLQMKVARELLGVHEQ